MVVADEDAPTRKPEPAGLPIGEPGGMPPPSTISRAERRARLRQLARRAVAIGAVALLLWTFKKAPAAVDATYDFSRVAGSPTQLEVGYFDESDGRLVKRTRVTVDGGMRTWATKERLLPGKYRVEAVVGTGTPQVPAGISTRLGGVETTVTVTSDSEQNFRLELISP